MTIGDPPPLKSNQFQLIAEPPKKQKGPRPAKVKRPQLESVIDEFIASQHCTLYGRAFDVGPEGSRPIAVEFFTDFFEEINARLS